MRSVVCGARNRAGMPCKAPRVRGGKRCRLHGGMSTGPTSALWRLAAGERLRLYRITDGGRGKPKTDKTRRRREAKARRLKMWLKHQERREARRAKWLRRKAIESGLPLVNSADFGQTQED
jgi:hypothetical protein